VHVQFSSATVNPRTGVVTVTGKITCSEWTYVDYLIEVQQQVGRIYTINGADGAHGDCETPASFPASFTYRVSFTANSGVFKPGPALVKATIWYCAMECGMLYPQQNVRLAPAR
jgi:hypothetical protein